jgi:hypothetical protein
METWTEFGPQGINHMVLLSKSDSVALFCYAVL